MLRILFTLTLALSLSQARCPNLTLQEFADILHSNKEEAIIDGKLYSIYKRKIPNYTIQSSSPPLLKMREKEADGKKICRYSRMIGNVKLGTFTLRQVRKTYMHAEDQAKKKRVVIVEDSAPPLMYEDRPPVIYRPAPFAYGGPVILGPRPHPGPYGRHRHY
ncbi:hypothetical protein [Candidatus Odyssella thessalonicensis]|uniref:hypothetical protein n=1 Tax=Candidatus Odyssella thessalonicensis TaxID=84647 RepID=UPI000225AF6E|nr:hypothetical protein [Candidatus Odyssella thessalonicensis]